MFTSCKKLESLDVSGFDTRNVTSMEEMFRDCQNLRTLDIRGFNTRNLRNADNMFDGCDNLPSSVKKFGKKGVFGTLKSWLKNE